MADSELHSLAEFQKLTDQRDLAALNCVNAIQFVLSMFECQDFEQSRKYLQDALDKHKHADNRITEFLVRHKNQKENAHHAA